MIHCCARKHLCSAAASDARRGSSSSGSPKGAACTSWVRARARLTAPIRSCPGLARLADVACQLRNFSSRATDFAHRSRPRRTPGQTGQARSRASNFAHGVRRRFGQSPSTGIASYARTCATTAAVPRTGAMAPAVSFCVPNGQVRPRPCRRASTTPPRRAVDSATSAGISLPWWFGRVSRASREDDGRVSSWAFSWSVVQWMKSSAITTDPRPRPTQAICGSAGAHASSAEPP